jgi:hypothetical protein
MLAIVGDIHCGFAKFGKLVREIHQKNPNVTAVIQVGDFGFYPRYLLELMKEEFPIPVYWIDGNHEAFYPLLEYTSVTEIHKNVFYVPRGTVLKLDERVIAFLGGAASVDKQIRLRQGMDWSVLENIRQHEVDRFNDVESVDLFITHCPPQSVIQQNFDSRILVEFFELPASWRDPNADIIERVWEKFGKPPLFCGHMHKRVQYGNCRILDIFEVAYI